MAASLVPFSPLQEMMDIYQYSSYKPLNSTVTLQLDSYFMHDTYKKN